MRGKVAKQIRKVVFALQAKKGAPVGDEYRINPKGQIKVFGGRAVYLGLKRRHREWRGFKKPKEAPKLSARAKAEWQRHEDRERKRYARQRRRTREREAREDEAARANA